MVQRLARQIERDRCAAVVHPHVDGRAGRSRVDDGPLVALRTHAVDDGVFHLERREPRVAQLVVRAVRPHRHRGIGREHVFPGEIVGARIEQVGVARVDAPDDEHDARGEARPQAGAHDVLDITEKRGAPAQGTHAFDSKGFELGSKRLLQTGEAAREEFKFGQ